MSETKDTEIRSKYDDFTVEELTEELNNVFFCSSPITGKEVSEMEQLLDILRQRDPLPGDSESEDLWGRFLEVHGDEVAKLGIRNTEEVVKKEAEAASVKRPDAAVVTPVKAPAPVQERGFRKLLHTALIAAAVVAVMVIVTVSASAAGINIWGWIPVRGEGTVRFVPEEKSHSTSVDIPSALKQLGIEQPLFPTWLPDGFILCDQQIRLNDPIRVFASYARKDEALTIAIRAVSNDSEDVVIETEDGNTLNYRSNGNVHNITTNFAQLVAYWTESGFLVKISGDVSVSEMEHIIDSIYNEVKT